MSMPRERLRSDRRKIIFTSNIQPGANGREAGFRR
jgi:hypothetical protein